MYGHVYKLAKAIEKGAQKIEEVEVKLLQVPETLSEDILKLLKAPPKEDVPVADPFKDFDADAFLFGFPTRFGVMPAQFKAFLDATGQLWSSGALKGKPYGLFTSTGQQGCGQETTLLTSIPVFSHHGMVFVPLGLTHPDQSNLKEIKGGSAYGSGTVAFVPESPTELELRIAEYQGETFAQFIHVPHLEIADDLLKCFILLF